MLSAIKHHMSSIEDIEMFPILSLLIFFLFFSAVSWYAYRAPKESMDESLMMPFNEGVVLDDDANKTKSN